MTALPPPRSGVGSAARGLTALSAGAGNVIVALGAAPRKLSHRFRQRFPLVAVTGMSGVGKTRLVDRLSRHSGAPGGEETGSAVMERRTRRTARGHGFRFRVVPGDNAATRLGALDDVFHDEPVDGVLHVVAYGHATPRKAVGVDEPASTGREAQLAAELEDWTITGHLIAAMAVRSDRPVWLVIVVTKTDLFPDQVEQAVRYYSPGSGTPFGNKLDELRALAGGARLSIDVVPMSVPTESEPATSSAAKDQLAGLERRMAQLSGHV
ncbi:GTPase domain-containing protein [Gephyromycinifex aptenodytis]|uniref:GTPase domain-containing protein n=1 Tax=Gephyromycinifex aptenodytis TaxID=2716227 RepID=UPI001447A5BD|nr:GTPase domain-containing protein [Gephyromycinifex aptenodytis]